MSGTCAFVHYSFQCRKHPGGVRDACRPNELLTVAPECHPELWLLGNETHDLVQCTFVMGTRVFGSIFSVLQTSSVPISLPFSSLLLYRSPCVFEMAARDDNGGNNSRDGGSGVMRIAPLPDYLVAPVRYQEAFHLYGWPRASTNSRTALWQWRSAQWCSSALLSLRPSRPPCTGGTPPGSARVSPGSVAEGQMP